MPPDDPSPSPPNPRHPILARPGRIALALALLLLGLLIAAGAWVAALIPQTPSIDDLQQVRAARPSVLLTADGKVLATFRRNQSEPVPLERVSPYVVGALLSTEDRRFYQHHGIDPGRTLAAVWHSLHGDLQGGSTITQQLARNLFPEDVGHARNVTRKVREMITALRIERVYSKRQILADYLNSAPFLYNTVGIEAAARTYFNTSASALNPAQAATLVAMLKGTDYYNPVLHPERARRRRDLVLQQMAQTGALTAAQAQHWQATPLQVSLTLPDDNGTLAPHFTAYARRWLLDWARAHDVDLYRDGLVVQTTIDSALQQQAEAAVERETALLQQVTDVEWGSAALVDARDPQTFARLHAHVTPFRHFFARHPELIADFLRDTPQYRARRSAGASDAAALSALRGDEALVAQVRRAKTRLEAGFVAMDPDTGEVKAWVGSRSFADDQFDHVAQAERQPGSTFKPIVYAAALESGIGPGRGYVDGPVEVRLDDNTVWRPTDMHGFSGEVMSLTDGLVYSKNTITAQVGQEVGVPRIVTLAQAMGIDQSKLDPVPSLALGTSPVTLLEMADTYCTIASQGVHRKPVFIRRIARTNGEVLAEFVADAQRALSVSSAVNLIEMMRGVVERGTGTAIRTRFDIGADVAGKTGTTQNNTDGWFILMHPHLVAGAWVGFDDQRVTMRSDYWGQGGHNAVLLVGDFFRHALRAHLIDARAEFPQPEQPVIWASDTGLPGDPSAAGPDGDLSDVLAGDAQAPITVARDRDGHPVLGDPAGVASMQDNAAPPKSAEELEQAFGRAPGERPPTVNTSGTGSAPLLPGTAGASSGSREAGAGPSVGQGDAPQRPDEPRRLDTPQRLDAPPRQNEPRPLGAPQPLGMPLRAARAQPSPPPDRPPLLDAPIDSRGGRSPGDDR
jgi:penicillin-binding protein 1A